MLMSLMNNVSNLSISKFSYLSMGEKLCSKNALTGCTNSLENDATA